MTQPGRRVLVLYWQEPFRRVRPTIRQHLRLFEASPAGHTVHYANLALGLPPAVRRGRFDVIVLHTTLLCARWFPQFAEVRDRVAWAADATAFKVALPQDEYDHAGVLDDWLADLRTDLIGTNFGPDHQPILYPRMHRTTRFLKCLTGYIDAGTARAVAPSLRPAAARSLDLVYRANHLPYWFGSHGQLKHQIAVRAKSAADRLGLRADISTAPADTIGSDRWYEFLASARATIGCESGSSALDARGEIRAAVRRLLADRPDLSFDEVSARLPSGWDSHRFFAIGPRHLEAVITRTCQVLVEGEYDGILRPGAHYLPVRRDLGNLDEALAMVRDDALVDTVTRQAYEDVFLSGRLTYVAAAQAFDAALPPGPVGPRRPGSDALLRARLGAWQLGRLAVRAVCGGLRAVRRRLLRPSPVSPPARPRSQVTIP